MNDDLMPLYDVPLSDKDGIFLGRIMALWGALESEVFVQTLAIFDLQDGEELPNTMNNFSFVKVLELWKARVGACQHLTLPSLELPAANLRWLRLGRNSNP